MTILRVCTVGNCWKWANFTICLYIHALVLLRSLPSLEGKHELFCRKKEEKAVSQTQVRQTIASLKVGEDTGVHVGKAPPNHKSLATFSHFQAGIQTWAIVRETIILIVYLNPVILIRVMLINAII